MIKLDSPDLQINFAHCLVEIRKCMLLEALQNCINKLDISLIDSQLHTFVLAQDLKILAKSSLRGELFFAVPYVLEACPKLLGYYRLLLGFSQKAFYTSESGIGQFRSMEDNNTLSKSQIEQLSELCTELNKCASILL